ncbi:MAG: DUF5119 domain-containing protein [Prevotella sp.]|nr:DUF5119 domain-containing protein [Prevotella sp.]
MTYKNCLRRFTPLAAAAIVLLTANSCRRDLWVFQDNYQQVEVNIDWRNYYREWGITGYAGTQPGNPSILPAADPDGMTVWFFPRDGRTSFRYTTAEVRHFSVYLSQDKYDGVVIDYSPEEYGRQEFVGMDFANTAKVQSTPASYQADSIPDLFGSLCYAHQLPNVNANGYYTIANEPEDIASDTVFMDIKSGKYDRYIPYEERDTYQQTLVNQVFNMEPLIIPWNMRVRIYVKGIYYLWKVQASLAGVADGYYLVDCKSSSTPCLLKLDDWEVYITGDNVGYIAKTFKTWGPMNFENRNWDVHTPQRPQSQRDYTNLPAIDGYSYEELSSRNPDEMRLNLRFLLRDRKTSVYYHFDVADMVNVFRNEYALRIDLMEDDVRVPNLPFVEAYNGMEFGGIVVPWAPEDPVDVQF